MQMTTLNFEKFKVKGANMGEESCLPDIKNDDYLRATLNIDESVPEEDRKYIKKGGINSLIVGNYLTTTGSTIEDDLEMIKKLGLKKV